MGDAWYFVDDDADLVHMFHLTWPPDRNDLPFVGHAVSGDLINWETLEPALRQGSTGSWDDRMLCTGSVIKYDGRYWMAYGSTSSADSPDDEPWRLQRGGMAVSDDLVAWEKLPENPVTQVAGPHYEGLSTGQRKMVNWRDHFFFDTGDAVYQFVCARRPDGDVKTRGTVGLTRSTDMRNWELRPQIEHDRVADEMEVPQIHHMDGRWYLVFCTLGRLLSPEFGKRFEGNVPERSNFSMVSDSPFGPFRIHGTGQIADHPPDDYFYAAQLVHFHGQWNLLVTIHDDGPERISDPIPVRGDETGVHASQ